MAGRPPFEPTDEQKRNVEAMTGYGIPQDEIRMLVVNPTTGEPISKPTLEKHFRRELDVGMTKANARVSESLYQKALGDGPASVTAAIWWTKARMGWKERIEHTGNLNVTTLSDSLDTIDGTTRGLPTDQPKPNGNGRSVH